MSNVQRQTSNFKSQMKITYSPIGIINSPYSDTIGMPIQPAGSRGAEGKIQLFDEFVPGLKDLDGFSHIILLYHFHKAKGPKLIVTPFLDNAERGLFSTRAPSRPNPIGLSVVRLEKIEGNIVRVRNIDVLDGTPLLDIKPFIPEFDAYDPDVRTGWFKKVRNEVTEKKSDGRFS